MDLRKLTFMSSSELKRTEFSRSGLQVIEGEVPEVMGTPDEVIIHKAKAVPAMTLVEDTYVELDGEPIVDWKTSWDQYKDIDQKDFTWKVRLAYHDGTNIFVYDGELLCFFDLSEVNPTSANFDTYARLKFFMDSAFIADAKEANNWHGICPRARAIYNLTWNETTLTVPLALVKDWEGEYQK